jgi:hypothetical protein
MTDLDKSHYYCHTHSNLFSQQTCEICYRGMCHTCIQNNESICPSCLKKSYFGSTYQQNKKNLIWIRGSGLIGRVLFLLYSGYGTSVELTNNFNKGAFMAFLGGANFTATHYFLEDNDFIEKVKNFPFFGFQLSVVVLIFIFVTGIPILYFIYKIVKQRF